MTGLGKGSTAIRLALIGALVALGLAIGFVAQEERALSAALMTGALDDLAALPGRLRVALGLLLIALAALGYLIFAFARRVPAEQPVTGDPAEEAPAPAIEAPSEAAAGPLMSADTARMVVLGGLLRRFCHELNNTLNPVQGYADLLVNDTRLGDLHRRHVAKIAQSAALALQDIERFAAPFGWSGRRGAAVQLDDTVAAAAAVAQSALGARLALEMQPGADVETTATEAELGQSILQACAAIAPLLAEREMQIAVKIDSLVGAASTNLDDGAGADRRLEIWSDPFDPARTKVQFGALKASWRYGRVLFEATGHGWPPELAGRLFNSDLPDDDASCLFMTLLGRMIVDLGGAITVDTRPLQHVNLTMFWPTRIASEVAAPLELDTAGDDLDVLIIDPEETAAEALSRRLEAHGLNVASTTSAETALELLAEMGPRCRAVMIGPAAETKLLERIRAVAPGCLVLFSRSGSGSPEDDPQAWPIEPDEEGLQRLVARLRRGVN